MLEFILFRKIILFPFQPCKYFLKIGPEIHEKLWVEKTKLQICQSQKKSDIDRKFYYYTRKWIVSFESKNTQLKTKKPNRKPLYQGQKSKTDTER